MLVAIPIGLIVWTLISDVVYLAQDKDEMWYDIAYWSSIAAIVSAVVAAIPGLVDYLGVVSKTSARQIGLMHMGMNTVVAVLFVIAAILMRDHGAADGSRLSTVIALHAVGVGVLLISGWLGGEMVYRHRIGVDMDAVFDEDGTETRVRPATNPLHRYKTKYKMVKRKEINTELMKRV